MTRQEHITEEDEKEKYIESIKKPLGCDYDYCLSCYTHARKSCMLRPQAEALYFAGYRKATEVIDEFVERLKQYEESVKIGIEWKAVVRDVYIERIAAEMRQKVENGE